MSKSSDKKTETPKNDDLASLERETSVSDQAADSSASPEENALAALEEQRLRLQAEMQNVRRRAERDVANARKFGVEKLLQDMLPVIDSMHRALEASEDAENDPMVEGMVMTLSLLEKTLEKHGMKVINPESGDRFNPDHHEAMSTQPGTEQEPNTITQVLQKGYELNGRVLRAAMVIVAQ